MKTLLTIVVVSLFSSYGLAAQFHGNHATTVTTINGLTVTNVSAKDDGTVEVALAGVCHGDSARCGGDMSVVLDPGCESDRVFYQQLTKAESTFSMASLTVDADGKVFQVDVCLGNVSVGGGYAAK